MSQELDFTNFVDELSKIADNLFDALRGVQQLQSDLDAGEWVFSSHFSEEHWRQLSNNIRLCVLELVYATYFGGDDTSETLIAWRKDIYTELDALTPVVTKLRKIK